TILRYFYFSFSEVSANFLGFPAVAIVRIAGTLIFLIGSVTVIFCPVSAKYIVNQAAGFYYEMEPYAIAWVR
uniref:hypothetical protein n=1 Tax=uncultured Ruminococcus sp. TaxID=165186 RepID=UPI002591B3ED